MNLKKNMKRWLKWSFLSVLSGILAGLAATLFLVLLDEATSTRDSHPKLIWLLPIGGLVLGWIYHFFGKDIQGGNNLILEEIHSPQKRLPLKMAPLILLGTIVTHLFGGSAGREGTAVQMGAALSDQLSRIFTIEPEERRILLVTGVGAGFGAAIGAPWAGALFGMEVVYVGRLRPFAWIECLLASFSAYFTTLLLKAPHSIYPKIGNLQFNLNALLWTAFAGALFGLTALAFSRVTHGLEKLERKGIAYPPLRPFAAGLILIGLYRWEGTYRYVGLGIPVIQKSFVEFSRFQDPLFKFLFTALTVASGFKGGEFIPLVFMGSTLGSALSQFLPIPTEVLAATGFAAIFGAASKTPLSCAVMAVELFGLGIAPYAFVGCFVGYLLSGQKGIYSSQKKKVV